MQNRSDNKVLPIPLDAELRALLVEHCRGCSRPMTEAEAAAELLRQILIDDIMAHAQKGTLN